MAGRTGAGKSTVFKLLLGLCRPRSGEVLIGGVDAAAIPDTQKRRIFGCVEQSFHMVPGSVKDQITLFDPSVSFDDVKAAARLVGLDETIEALPEGVRYGLHAVDLFAGAVAAACYSTRRSRRSENTSA